jgi:hypothetical protein
MLCVLEMKIVKKVVTFRPLRDLRFIIPFKTAISVYFVVLLAQYFLYCTLENKCRSTTVSDRDCRLLTPDID